MTFPFVAARGNRGGTFAAAAAAPAATSSLVDGEQDVMDLAPAGWWDASYDDAVEKDSGVASDGEDVAKWISREGNSIELVQATASKQPIFNASNSDFNDYSTITFDSTADQWLGKDTRYVDTSGNVGTIFYVGKEQNGDSVARIVNWAFNGQSNIGTNYGSKALFSYNPVAQFGTLGDQLNAYMAVVSIDGASSYSSMNEGTNVTFTANANMTVDSGYTSVGGYGATTENASTIAAEYIIFNTALIPDNVATVETYLKNKYDGF